MLPLFVIAILLESKSCSGESTDVGSLKRKVDDMMVTMDMIIHDNQRLKSEIERLKITDQHILDRLERKGICFVY